MIEYRDIQKNWIFHPYNEWTLQHISEILRTSIVSKRDGQTLPFKKNKECNDLSKIKFRNFTDKEVPVEQWLKDSNTDGFIVIHNGEICYEAYFHNMRPYTRHQMFSVTKSFIGTIATIYMVENKLDVDKNVTEYVPELKGTAYNGVKVRDVLNMTVSLNVDIT